MIQKLRVISPAGGHEIGQILEIDMPDVASMLIARGIAVPYDENDPAIPPPNKMLKREKVKTK